jgi:hypothetical protein
MVPFPLENKIQVLLPKPIETLFFLFFHLQGLAGLNKQWCHFLQEKNLGFTSKTK